MPSITHARLDLKGTTNQLESGNGDGGERTRCYTVYTRDEHHTLESGTEVDDCDAEAGLGDSTQHGQPEGGITES